MPFSPETSNLPTSEPDLCMAVARLAALAKESPPDVDREGSETDRFIHALPGLAKSLAPIRAELSGTLLGRLVSDRRFDGEPNEGTLTKEGKRALKKGTVIASEDASVWILEPQKGGFARVAHAHPESFAILGDSIAEWLDAEAGRIESLRRGKPTRRAEGKAVLDDGIRQLAKWSGVDVTTKLAASLPKPNQNRWDYFRTAVAACGPIWSQSLLAATESRLLGLVLRGSLFHEEPDVPWTSDVEKDYPRAARRALREGWFIATKGSAIWFLVRTPQGKTQMNWAISLHHADTDGYEKLADSVEEWLEYELRRLQAIGM